MITGDDLLYWFSDLWFDITHLSTADIPSLLARLVLLFFVFLITKGILSVLWRVLYRETAAPLLSGFFNLVTWPIRAPFNAFRTWRQRRQSTKDHARWQEQQDRQARADREADEAARLAQEQAQMAELARLEQLSRIE